MLIAWKRTVLIGCLCLAALAGSSTSEAAGRGRGRSPFVKTPFGWIPKSVYNQGFVRNPAKLEQYRQSEQQYWAQIERGRNGATTTKKPTSIKKK